MLKRGVMIQSAPPPPTLRIQYNTTLIPIPEPLLYHTLEECEDVIETRQKNLSTRLDVTVTDINTNQVMKQHYSSQQEFPVALLYYQVRSEWLQHHTALVHACYVEYKNIRSSYKTYRTLLWYTQPEHPPSARQLALAHITAIRVETSRALQRLQKLRRSLTRLALTQIAKRPFQPRAFQ